LDKFYILTQYIGIGIGNSAFEILFNTLQFHGKESLLLSVIDTNVNAIRFYEKLEFSFTVKPDSIFLILKKN